MASFLFIAFKILGYMIFMKRHNFLWKSPFPASLWQNKNIHQAYSKLLSNHQRSKQKQLIRRLHFKHRRQTSSHNFFRPPVEVCKLIKVSFKHAAKFSKFALSNALAAARVNIGDLFRSWAPNFFTNATLIAIYALCCEPQTNNSTACS